tara:strand:- start:7261 stop:7425 length:165 start_codon:yes stop_codon:yes gene_type:complete
MGEIPAFLLGIETFEKQIPAEVYPERRRRAGIKRKGQLWGKLSFSERSGAKYCL